VTSTLPIVMAVSSDPVGDGLVASLAQPGGNITGLSIMTPELTGKRLELLREAVPGLARVALLLDARSPRRHLRLQEHEAAARVLGVHLQPLEVRGPEEFAGAFQAALQGQAQAVIIPTSPLFTTHRDRLAALALASRLPTMAGNPGYAHAGGLMDYGANQIETWQRAATYVHKILHGAKPADLPVEQPTQFKLVLNRKTAQVLGITFPPTLLVLAEEVIQEEGTGAWEWTGEAPQSAAPRGRPQPNQALVAPREARNLGIERVLMKLVTVTQWVRAIWLKSHLIKA
jgi:putative tryptophan/tyrosine transport system substrate-binding protein